MTYNNNNYNNENNNFDHNNNNNNNNNMLRCYGKNSHCACVLGGVCVCVCVWNPGINFNSVNYTVLFVNIFYYLKRDRPKSDRTIRSHTHLGTYAHEHIHIHMQMDAPPMSWRNQAYTLTYMYAYIHAD